jgi:hypothetical protein
LDDFALGVLCRVVAEASRFLIVSRFSLCSRAGALGLARAAASGLGLSGEDTAGALSPSSGRLIGGTSVGVLERERGRESAILRDPVADGEGATAVSVEVATADPGHAAATAGGWYANATKNLVGCLTFSNFYYSLLRLSINASWQHSHSTKISDG